MITTIISDFSYVILFPVDSTYSGTLNDMYSDLLESGEFDYLTYYTFNMALLNYYASLRDKYSVNIFTSGKVQMHPDAMKITEKYFDNVVSAMKYDLLKTDPKVYELLLNDLGVTAEECVFIDDSPGNVHAAEEAGIRSIQFEDNESLQVELEALLAAE